MKLITRVLITLMALSATRALASRILYTPTASGQASGSSFFTFQGAFDTQPTLATLPPSGTNTISGTTLGSNVPSFPNDTGIRVGFIDFGVDFSTVHIVELWTAYRNFTNYNGAAPFVDLWWADSNTLNVQNIGGVNTVIKDAATTTNITDTAFNFGTNAASTGGSDIIWARDVEFSTPVTPERRYLMLASSMAANTTANFAGGRATELAIVVIPEPSTLAVTLLALGGLLWFRRRK